MGKAEKYTRLGRDLDASSLMNAKFKPRGVPLEPSRAELNGFHHRPSEGGGFRGRPHEALARR